MQFPREFNNLLSEFHVDFFRGRSPEEAVQSALIHIGEKQREIVKQFLDKLLSEPYDVEELHRLWWASPADIAPSTAWEMPAMLKLIRDQIDSPRVQSSTVS